ncbi:MAG: endonuclease/exonuclease/phosphatase family protein [Actinomycetota bacterium]|nr:endonuclease/exonuclease/phosphatase family protein [Actinomycetota bacterium]
MTRLATFNILHGRSPADGSVSTSRLVEACASLDADLLCLQEVDRNQPRSGSVDQTAAVAEAMGAAAWRFEPALIGEPGATWKAATDDAATADSEEPAYGIGLVSRLPVAAWHVIRLPAAPVRSPVAVPGAGWRATRFILLPDEPRVAMAAELAAGVRGPNATSDLVVATTHLSFVPGYNLLQVRRLTARLARLAAGRPTILLGDLNVPGPFPGWASGWRALTAAKTFPADRPTFQVDHVLGHGPVPAVAGAEARRLPLSDHRALVVDLAG